MFPASLLRFLSTMFFVLLLCAGVRAQHQPLFKDGDRVAFIGNSITQDGRYHMLLQAFFATRFPGNKVSFFNCGIAGDVADGMLRRFEEDILSHKPDHAFLMTGMNDAPRWSFGAGVRVDTKVLEQRKTAFENYKAKTALITEKLVAAGVRPILITPSIFDQTAVMDQVNLMGVNDELERYSAYIRDLAAKQDLPVVDFQAVMRGLNAREQAKDPTFTIVGPDRVHPGEVGHFIMAREIIKVLFPNRFVSSVEMDAANGTLQLAHNCRVKVDREAKLPAFTLQPNALPFVVDKGFRPGLDLLPFREIFNQEMLRIKNLPAGTYALHIDDVAVDTFSAEEIGNGVDLALNPRTPQYQQAERVFRLCQSYHKTYGKLRSIAFVTYQMLKAYKGDDSIADKRAFLTAKNAKSVGESWHEWHKQQTRLYFELLPQEEQLRDELEAVRTQIYTANQPVLHRYALTRL